MFVMLDPFKCKTQVQNSSFCFFGNFWNFILNICNLRLVESPDVQPMDMEEQMHNYFWGN